MAGQASALAPVFEVSHLTKIYHMGEVDVHALRDVSLQLPESEFVVLLGPSGSGKSTLLNIIGGLDVPTSGAGALPRHRPHARRRGGAHRATGGTTSASSSSSTT